MFQRSRSNFFRAVVTVLTIATTGFAQQPKTHTDMLVSTQWLADHLSDPKLVIVHVGGADGYQTAHIPGARLLALDKIATQHDAELLPDEQLKTNLEAIGV